MRCTGMRHRRSRRDASGSESKASWSRIGEREWRSVGRSAVRAQNWCGKAVRTRVICRKGRIDDTPRRACAGNQQAKQTSVVALLDPGLLVQKQTTGVVASNIQPGRPKWRTLQQDEGGGWCSRAAVTQQKTTSSGAKQMLIRQPMQVNVVENRERGRGQRQGQRRWRWRWRWRMAMVMVMASGCAGELGNITSLIRRAGGLRIGRASN